ncbi:alpha/beta hydrolase [Roseomonas sp. BN140053]|uniref:alpha/beta hydrolase n=1 Tax=Roseomonas sp. BN140053 TaxID=3391898 RepID=UPI0039EBD733
MSEQQPGFPLAAVPALGHRFDPAILEATRALYAPLLPPPAPEIRVQADIPYGEDTRQKLDLYLPASPNGASLLFVPGGGFVGGDKDADGTFYGNLGRYFAAHGFLTAAMNYRLAPAHGWPAGSEDVAAALAWLQGNAAAQGASANRTFLFGQSAGAAHCAGFLFDSRFHPPGGAGVTAAVLMSGPYRVGASSSPGAKAYYGTDESTYLARSPLTHASNSTVPLLLSVAEFDPAPLAAPSFELAAAFTLRDGRSPRFAWFAGHNHVSTVMSLGTPQDDVGATIRGFLGRFG